MIEQFCVSPNQQMSETHSVLQASHTHPYGYEVIQQYIAVSWDE